MADQTTTNDAANHAPSRSGGYAPGALWASAFVIAGMILAQAGRVGIEAQARADVSEVGDLTIATMEVADGAEPVAILSRRSERVFFYGVHNGRELRLLATENLPEAFGKARTLAGNTGR